MSLRFNEANVNAQCRACNRFDEGNMEGYRRGLIQKYGPDIIDKLYAAKHNVFKLGKFEMKIMKQDYTAKANGFKKVKMVA